MVIAELIDEQVKKLNDEKKLRDKKAFWASDAFKCPRKIYFDFKHRDKAEAYEPRILRIFQCGDDVHERICKYLEMADILEDVEVEIPGNVYNIHGRADALLKDGIVVEIKSINVKSMSTPIKEHVGQLQLYLYLLKKDVGILLYECKPNQKIYEFVINKDMDIIKDILKGFRKLQPCLLKCKPPTRETKYNKNKYPCKYCQYTNLCYKK